MKLQAGRRYVRRDGQVTGPLEGEDGLFNSPKSQPEYRTYNEANDGFYYESKAPQPEDLVAEWSAPVYVEPDEYHDQMIVEGFNRLVKAGRIQVHNPALDLNGTDRRQLPSDRMYFLKPTTRETTLPDSGYRVVVEGDTVKVGRQRLDRLWLRIGLNGLCRDKVAQTDGIVPLIATRTGMRCSDKEITWADADHLLAFLEGK
jgi:hypothetical protein